MLNAFLLALGQLSDGPILRLLGKIFLLTLALVIALGAGAYYLVDWLLSGIASDDQGWLAAMGSLTTILAALAAALTALFLFRVVALFVINIYSDDVVEAVEARHYPSAAQSAKPPSYALGLRMGVGSVLRALGYNLLALPVYILLLVTGIGTAAAFFVVNGLLIGRDLQDMVASRHVAKSRDLPPEWRLTKGNRFLLGLVTALLLAVPFVNFLAPVLGAAMATHLVHSKRVKEPGA